MAREAAPRAPLDFTGSAGRFPGVLPPPLPGSFAGGLRAAVEERGVRCGLWIRHHKQLILRSRGKKSLAHEVVAAPPRRTSAGLHGEGTSASLGCLVTGCLFFLPPVFTKFISFQDVKHQYHPLAKELFAAGKSEVVPGPAALRAVGTAVEITRQAETKLLLSLVLFLHLSNPTIIFGE